jgi:hypothetical protein
MFMLIALFVTVLIIALLFYVLAQFPVQQPWKNILTAILTVLAIIWLLGFLPYVPWYYHYPR